MSRLPLRKEKKLSQLRTFRKGKVLPELRTRKCHQPAFFSLSFYPFCRRFGALRQWILENHAQTAFQTRTNHQRLFGWKTKNLYATGQTLYLHEFCGFLPAPYSAFIFDQRQCHQRISRHRSSRIRECDHR